jgi:hypothetical protein
MVVSNIKLLEAQVFYSTLEKNIIAILLLGLFVDGCLFTPYFVLFYFEQRVRIFKTILLIYTCFTWVCAKIWDYVFFKMLHLMGYCLLAIASISFPD